MNKALVLGIASVFCFGFMQDAQAKLFKKKSEASEETNTSSKKKKGSLFKNLFKSKKAPGKHSTKMDTATAVDQITSFETYLSVLGSWKADKDAIKRVQPLVNAIFAFSNGEQPTDAVDTINAVLQSGDPGMLKNNDYVKVAIILGERLLRNNLKQLSQSLQQTARRLQITLTYIIGTNYATKGDHDLLDDVQKVMK